MDYSACPDAGKQKNTQHSNQSINHRQVISCIFLSNTISLNYFLGPFHTGATFYVHSFQKVEFRHDYTFIWECFKLYPIPSLNGIGTTHMRFLPIPCEQVNCTFHDDSSGNTDMRISRHFVKFLAQKVKRNNEK